MAAAVAAAIQSPRKQSSAISVGHQRATGVKNAILHIRRKSFAFEHRVTTASSPYSGGRCCIVAASNSPNEEANSNADDPDLSFTSQEDVNFLLKLGGGSLAGAAAIKYGSILVPQITQPNITQALIMISTPVVVAVLILIIASRVEQR
ncbi:uncharacterized protein LOC111910193 [Lactuca sativa]|uniref:Uncharacterized protein n=1 Tax=Lactuca sativa TaxID=4236 RepID=A0A9R1VFK3_LACSA|nr:uncharacterized protein LOC111910193 [Lactuca sativa]KAJ0203847.1 hypothetical protein LSAT_V11C500275300 [Lactuca sativa]